MKPYYQDDLVTIYHGDCREVLVDPGLPFEAVVVTDPPYGETSHAWDVWPEGWPALLNVSSMWCFGSMRLFLAKGHEFRAAGWRLSQDVVWEKDDGSGFDTDRFRRVHEVALHWYRGNWGTIYHAQPRTPRIGPSKGVIQRSATAAKTKGQRGASTYVDDGWRMARSVLFATRVRYVEGQHPTEKPLAILTPLIDYAIPPTGTLLDPFAGSGSSLLAAKHSGRRSIGIEMDERWCEVAATRCSQEVLGLTS